MGPGATVDGVLVQWGERLFYPSKRIVRAAPTPRLDTMTRRKAAVIRRRIEATVTGRAPQVMVKVTGGGRGMAAIAAHFRYISKNGQLDIEDDRSVVREAFNIMLSMPHGTDARLVQKAAREFAQAELPGHRYVMVLHDHQANPHVHLSVRAESRTGKRLNPRKTDLHRWRETFAEKLRGWGVDAEATRQATRGENRNVDPLWRVKAKREGRLRQTGATAKTGQRYWDSRADAMKGWAYIIKALVASESPEDRKLADRVARFVQAAPFFKEAVRQRQREAALAPRQQSGPQPQLRKAMDRPGPELER